MGTQTGAQLTYNSEGELSNWQNQPSSPTTTAVFLYDGQGNRVAQQSTSGGTTTTTVYVGGIEEDVTTGASTTKKSYYYANGSRFAMAINGTPYAVVSDGLGSANVILHTGGNTVSSQLFCTVRNCPIQQRCHVNRLRLHWPARGLHQQPRLLQRSLLRPVGRPVRQRGLYPPWRRLRRVGPIAIRLRRRQPDCSDRPQRQRHGLRRRWRGLLPV